MTELLHACAGFIEDALTFRLSDTSNLYLEQAECVSSMDPRTVQAAEQQMRRTAPDEHTAKRRKTDDVGESSLAKLLSLL